MSLFLISLFFGRILQTRQTKNCGLKTNLVQESLSIKQFKMKKYTSYIIQNVKPKGVGRCQVEES